MLTVRVYPIGSHFLANVWEVPEYGAPMVLCTILKPTGFAFDTHEEALQAGEDHVKACLAREQELRYNPHHEKAYSTYPEG